MSVCTVQFNARNREWPSVLDLGLSPVGRSGITSSSRRRQTDGGGGAVWPATPRPPPNSPVGGWDLGTSNFLYLDGHVDAKNLAEKVYPSYQWGGKFYSLAQ